MDAELLASTVPSILWIELTSKCPFDCVFCSRKSRRGAGAHMEFELYRNILRQLQRPAMIRLNYSGESLHFPRILDAVKAAKVTGASVELVSALGSAKPALVREIAASGLDRLTVSLHTLDPQQYGELYRFSSLDDVKRNLEILAGSPRSPIVDLAFVAMERNLDELPKVARYAAFIGAAEVSVHPVIERDPLPQAFHQERKIDFIDQVRDQAKAASAFVPVTVARPLPPAQVHQTGVATCEQNPWETIHILSNGDVVVCEVLDRQLMGSVVHETLEAVWRGNPYRKFRAAYVSARAGACAECVWRRSGPIAFTNLIARQRGTSQFVRGWYADTVEPALWSRRSSAIVLNRSYGEDMLQLSGMLPGGALQVRCQGLTVATVSKPGEFDVSAPIPKGRQSAIVLEFETSETMCPARTGGADGRELGFALFKAGLVATKARKSAAALMRLVKFTDSFPHRRSLRFPPPEISGVSVIIPERGHPAMLAECLASVEQAIAVLSEPAQVIVVVNASIEEAYLPLQARFRFAEFLFHDSPLGFTRAIQAGLRHVRHAWVYLLNNDIRLEPDALRRLLPLRAPDVFSAGSRIRMMDGSSTETNWTSMKVENGLVDLLELDPQGGLEPRPAMYCGGGCSLFQSEVLRHFARSSRGYDPFYWEDVEWGVRASSIGYLNLFCPASIAHHRRRSTVNRYYPSADVERIFERNRMLFQFRTAPAGTDLRTVADWFARVDPRTVREFVLRLPESLRVRSETVAPGGAVSITVPAGNLSGVLNQ